MRAAGFPPGQGGSYHYACKGEQIGSFEVVYRVSARAPLAQLRLCRLSRRKAVRSIPAAFHIRLCSAGRSTGSLLVPERCSDTGIIQAASLCSEIKGKKDAGATLVTSSLSSSSAHRQAKTRLSSKRIGSESVGSVNAGAGDLADCEETWQGSAAPVISAHAAHPIVGCGGNGDGCCGPVEAASAASGVDGRETQGEERCT